MRPLAERGAQVKVASARAPPQCARMTETTDPADCTTMAEVRTGVDRLDRALVALLGRRFGYMRAAARIKPERAHVRRGEKARGDRQCRG